MGVMVKNKVARFFMDHGVYRNCVKITEDEIRVLSVMHTSKTKLKSGDEDQS